MINIAYTIWLENLNSSILRSQVYDMLKEKQKHSPQDKIYIIAFQPFYKVFSQKKRLKTVIHSLRERNIFLIQIPCFKIPKLGLSIKWYMLPFVFLQSFPAILLFKITKNISVFHCRSYPVTISSIFLKKLTNIKVVFDPRSSFPEEQLKNGKKGISFKIWKFIEKIYLNNADITISITESYTKHYKKIKHNTKFVEIPNNVDTNKFKPNKAKRNQLRSQLGICENEIIFCYSGSLNNPWNDPNTYADFVIQTRNLGIKHRFLFLTKNISKLNDSFVSQGISSDEYYAISCDLDDMPKNLSIADFGLNIMAKEDIRMSIKSAEYLAMGLPIIANSNVLGAKEIITKHNTGMVFENLSLNELSALVLSKDSLSINCRETACNFFSTEKVAQKYNTIYQYCIKRS